MTASVVYFNRGTPCYIRLLTSAFSLRKHFSGNMKLLQEGDLDSRIAAVLARLDVEIVPVRPTAEPVLVRKASLWREVTDDSAMFLDSDTLVCGPIDEFFEWINEAGFVATWFNGWNTQGARIARRIEEWTKVAPELIAPALAYGKAVNSGIFGWRRGSGVLPEYEELTRRGAEQGCNRLVLDEIALQLALPHHPHNIADHIWNTSGTFGNVEHARIIHYHGKKHCIENPRCDLWKKEYFELLVSFPECCAIANETFGDKRLQRFRESIARRRKDLTVVTVVDRRYAPKLKRNIKRWMQLPGLREQQFLVFVNGFKGAWERRFLDLPNVRVVRWDYGNPNVTRREFMLAAFVFGVARHVKTPYWMKLDADCEPVRAWWEWPEYERFTIVSHRWGFTRMKGDSESPRHWFNRLDDVFSPAKPYFKRVFNPANDRVSHHRGNPDKLPLRFNSFCHIEKSEFTRRIARMLQERNNGRLPIPSQDTISWYCSQLWGESVSLVNMRAWFRN